MAPQGKLHALSKRIFDMGFSLFGLMVSMPVWCLISLSILLQDGPPLFFEDIRIGKDGKPFKAIKFRSMIKDAEKLTGSTYAAKDDPRITPIGRVLRAAAMDELPQLVNIFKGDMSFVGPRPEKENYVETFKRDYPDYAKRHLIRPGLTGPAQIYLKYDTDQEEKLKYDLMYVDNANLAWDICLIAKSFMVTFKRGWEKFESGSGRG